MGNILGCFFHRVVVILEVDLDFVVGVLRRTFHKLISGFGMFQSVVDFFGGAGACTGITCNIIEFTEVMRGTKGKRVEWRRRCTSCFDFECSNLIVLVCVISEEKNDIEVL